MKKTTLLIMVLCLAFLAGCASNKVTTNYMDAEGKVYKVETVDITDSAMFHREQARIREISLVHQKPLLKINIPEGATLTATGGDISIEAYAPLGEKLANFPQYREPWLEGAGYAAPVVTAIGMLYMQNEMLKSLAALDIGGRYTFDNSFNGNNNSPASVGNKGNWTMSTTNQATNGTGSPIGNSNSYWSGPRDVTSTTTTTPEP